MYFPTGNNGFFSLAKHTRLTIGRHYGLIPNRHQDTGNKKYSSVTLPRVFNTLASCSELIILIHLMAVWYKNLKTNKKLILGTNTQ